MRPPNSSYFNLVGGQQSPGGGVNPLIPLTNPALILTFLGIGMTIVLPCCGWLVTRFVRQMVPVSLADAERAFSNYNEFVCSSRMSLSDESSRSYTQQRGMATFLAALKATISTRLALGSIDLTSCTFYE